MMNPFHALSLSAWPIAMSYIVISSFSNFSLSMKFGDSGLAVTNVIFISSLVMWSKDVSRESEAEMMHSSFIDKFPSMGTTLFIMSEVMFLVSLLWCHSDRASVVDTEVGSVWPPLGVPSINPFSAPLPNTLILLPPGVSTTRRHSSILNNYWSASVIAIVITLSLGSYLLLIQFYEYKEAPPTFVSSGYGSISFSATGLHGLHALLGCMMTPVSRVRPITSSMEAWVHYGPEFPAWYWHLVDAVWPFLPILTHWWGYQRDQ